LAIHIKKGFILVAICLVGASCAVLHRVDIGDIDDTRENSTPFEIKVSEVGVNLDDARSIARHVAPKGKGDDIMKTLQMFQMGPKTGNSVYVENYAEKLVYSINEKCPGGKITGLTTVRETRKYPVISGEIIKISGFCIR
jgi:hypothetical protein